MNRKTAIEKFKHIDLYPVISSEFCVGRSSVEVLKFVAGGGAKIVQLREKSLSKTEILKLAREYRSITLEHNMLLIVNDYVDIALEVDADGVHLGQDDCSLEKARKLAPELIFGISTHNKQEAISAQCDGADYINIGPIYTTQTKSLPFPALGTGILKEIPPLLNIPFTIMGGIKEKHLKELISLGATKIAMVTEITQAENITRRICELRKYFYHEK